MMLFRRKKEKNLCLLDEHGKELLCCAIHDLPLKEDIILAKSIEFFCDPEPCYIHRGAVMTRLYAEIEASIETLFTCNITLVDFKSERFNPFSYIDCVGFKSFSIK